MDFELLYQKTPIGLQNAIVSLVGWKINHRRYSKLFEHLLRQYEERSKWTREDIVRFRDKRIHTFAMHCEKNVPYYRNLFRGLKISGEDIHGLSDLEQLPVLQKSTVQEGYAEFIAQNIPPSQRVIAHTSGTTGGGLRFATTEEALSEQWAVWWRYRRWHGISVDTWCGYFGGRSVVPLSQDCPPFWRYNVPGHQILFSGYHMSPKNLEAYIGELRKRQPPWLHGYPSLLSLMASHILERDEKLGYQVRWITIGAENLLPQQANLIEKAFGVRPLQHYGMAEAVANISECKDGTLRVDEDFSAVEFIPNSNGSGYKIIGTNFSNLATPLLRYDTNDLAKIPTGGTPDEYGGRIVERIDGRQEDYIVLRNGARLGRMDHIFKDMTHIREAQLHQCELGSINIRIVRTRAYSNDDEQKLLREFRTRVGEDTVLHVEYVDELPRSRTGKMRFVVSEIPEEQISSLE